MSDPNLPAAPVVAHQEAGMPVVTEQGYLVVNNEIGACSFKYFIITKAEV